MNVLMALIFASDLGLGLKYNAKYKKEVARTVIIKSMIEEFHAEYGIYPPVDASRDGYGIHSINFTGPYPSGDDPEEDLRHYIYGTPSWKGGGNGTGEQNIFSFGLFSYFTDRYSYVKPLFFENRLDVNSKVYKLSCKAWGDFNDSIDESKKHSTRDGNFLKRIKPLADAINVQAPGTKYYSCPPAPSKNFTYGFSTGVYDTWGREYYYIHTHRSRLTSFFPLAQTAKPKNHMKTDFFLKTWIMFTATGNNRQCKFAKVSMPS